MKVVLLRDVKNLGRAGEVVEASNGYARNFLIRQKLAELATPQRLKLLEEKRIRTEKIKQKRLKQAENLINRLSAQTWEFTLPADEGGHLYSGLREPEILAKIRESNGVASEGLTLVDYESIKQIGIHRCKLSLGAGLSADINLLIKPKTS